MGTAALRRLVDASWQVVGVADFDGDRDADLLFRNTTTGRNAIWQFDGTTFVAAKALPALALTWYVVGTGDFNHDGTADIV